MDTEGPGRAPGCRGRIPAGRACARDYKSASAWRRDLRGANRGAANAGHTPAELGSWLTGRGRGHMVSGSRAHMSKHDAARRAFLVRAVVGAGSVAGAGLMPDVSAQNLEQRQEASSTTPETHATGAGHGTFFNARDAATISAFTERLMPGAPGMPGATDAGVLNYIDLALSGAYVESQDFYRRGLAQLDAYCRRTYNEPFVQLDSSRQDAVIAALEQDKAPGFTWPTAQAF